MSLFLVIQAAIGTPALIGLIAIVVFGIVYLARKFFGKQWEAVARLIPALNFDLTPGMVILSKAFQALPATIVAASIGAVASGGALTPTLLAALAGPLAAIGHELLKAYPGFPYQGATDNMLSPVTIKLPPDPKLPTGVGK